MDSWRLFLTGFLPVCGAVLTAGGEGNAGAVASGFLLSMLALLAQGYATETAARLAAYVHGLAGDIARKKHGAMGMTAGDIVDCLPLAWRMLEEE